MRKKCSKHVLNSWAVWTCRGSRMLNRPANWRASSNEPLPFWRGTTTATSNADHTPGLDSANDSANSHACHSSRSNPATAASSTASCPWALTRFPWGRFNTCGRCEPVLTTLFKLIEFRDLPDDWQSGDVSKHKLQAGGYLGDDGRRCVVHVTGQLVTHCDQCREAIVALSCGKDRHRNPFA